MAYVAQMRKRCLAVEALFQRKGLKLPTKEGLDCNSMRFDPTGLYGFSAACPEAAVLGKRLCPAGRTVERHGRACREW